VDPMLDKKKQRSQYMVELIEENRRLREEIRKLRELLGHDDWTVLDLDDIMDRTRRRR
jgi:regulator of replication initiation timing